MRNLNRKTDWIDEWHNQTQFNTQIHGRRQPDPYRPERRPPELTVRNPGVRPEPPHFLREESPPLGYGSQNRDHRERQRMAPRRLSKRKQSLMGNVGYWCNEELQFSMNKISIAGMVFGLMVLGTLFFVGGFLTAFIFYGSEPIMPAYVVAAPQTQQSWATANNGVPTYQQQGGVPVTATGAYPQYSQGGQMQYAQPYPQQQQPMQHMQQQQPQATSQNKYAKTAGNTATFQAKDQANRVQERAIGGTAQKLTSNLPGFAQPFAQTVVSDQTSGIRNTVDKGVDHSLGKGKPQMQQPQQQMQQPYYQPQMQQQQMQPQQPMRQPQAQGGAWQQQNMAQPAYYPPQY